MQSIVSLGHTEAQQAIQAIQNELTRRGKAAVIAVHRHGDEQGLDGGARCRQRIRHGVLWRPALHWLGAAACPYEPAGRSWARSP